MIIEINSEDEKLIRTRLQSGQFKDLEDLIHQALVSLSFLQRSKPNASLRTTPAERANAFREWAESHEEDIVLPDEAMKRSSFYGERG